MCEQLLPLLRHCRPDLTRLIAVSLPPAAYLLTFRVSCRSPAACDRLVEAGALAQLFAVFMGRSKIKNSKGEAGDRDVVREVEERCVSIISNLFQVCCVCWQTGRMTLYVRGRREDAGVQKYRLAVKGRLTAAALVRQVPGGMWPLRKRCSSQAVVL